VIDLLIYFFFCRDRIGSEWPAFKLRRLRWLKSTQLRADDHGANLRQGASDLIQQKHKQHCEEIHRMERSISTHALKKHALKGTLKVAGKEDSTSQTVVHISTDKTVNEILNATQLI